MRASALVEQQDGGRLRCGVCQWRCELAPGEVGRCLVRRAIPGELHVLNYGLISAAQLAAIEDFRFYHFFPGANMLGLGSWGYAFPGDQQRGQYAQLPEGQSPRVLNPERAANFALERLCRGIVFGYSDPAVAYEYVLDLLRQARASSRVTALVTSGYLTIAALDSLGPYLDGMMLELRAFDDAAYARLAGVEHWRGILEVAEHARKRWRCHLELLTRLHPGVNDAPEIIRAAAQWIVQALGPYTPWHLLPGDAGAAAAASVSRARRVAAESGLYFVYGADPAQPTQCPRCGTITIERSSDRNLRLLAVNNGRCAQCAEDLGLRLSIFK